MSLIEKCTDLTKNQDDLIKLLTDILPFVPTNTIINLVNLPTEEIEAYFLDYSTLASKERRGTEVTKIGDEINSIKEELPFIFNIS
jgi:hypothetical protein